MLGEELILILPSSGIAKKSDGKEGLVGASGSKSSFTEVRPVDIHILDTGERSEPAAGSLARVVWGRECREEHRVPQRSLSLAVYEEGIAGEDREPQSEVRGAIVPREHSRTAA